MRLQLYLWCEELVYSAGEEWFVQDGADRWPLPGVAFEQLAQEKLQVLGVVVGHGGVGPTDDLQNQVLHVASLELRIKGTWYCVIMCRAVQPS